MATPGVGPVAEGTDGTDFIHRQKVASHYQQSIQSKARLKSCIYYHYILFVVMLAKLASDILDRLDIFILEIEELYIPKPRLWEWIWTASVVFTWTGLKAIKKNNITSMKIYAVMNLLTSICPVLYALCYYLFDVWEFIDTHGTQNIEEVWRGYPVGLIWYPFLLSALQLHGFQLFSAYRLIRAWAIRKKKSNLIPPKLVL